MVSKDNLINVDDLNINHFGVRGRKSILGSSLERRLLIRNDLIRLGVSRNWLGGRVLVLSQSTDRGRKNCPVVYSS